MSKEVERNNYQGDLIKFPSSKLMALGGMSNAISSSDYHLQYMDSELIISLARGESGRAALFYEQVIRILKTRLIKEHCEL